MTAPRPARRPARAGRQRSGLSPPDRYRPPSRPTPGRDGADRPPPGQRRSGGEQGHRVAHHPLRWREGKRALRHPDRSPAVRVAVDGLRRPRSRPPHQARNPGVALAEHQPRWAATRGAHRRGGPAGSSGGENPPTRAGVRGPRGRRRRGQAQDVEGKCSRPRGQALLARGQPHGASALARLQRAARLESGAACGDPEPKPLGTHPCTQGTAAAGDPA